MNAIYLDREGVETVVSKIDAAIQTLEDAAKQLDTSMMNELGNYWQGNSYSKVIATYEESYQQMLKKTVPEAVEELQKFITDCKEAIIEVDRQLSGMG